MFSALTLEELNVLGDNLIDALATVRSIEFGRELAELAEDVLLTKFRLNRVPAL